MVPSQLFLSCVTRNNNPVIFLRSDHHQSESHEETDFWHKIKMYNCDPYNVLLAIAADIPVLLVTCRDTFAVSLFVFKAAFLRFLEASVLLD